MPARWLSAFAAIALALIAGAAAATDGDGQNDATAQWWASLNSCNADNRPACDTAVEHAAQLFGRTDRNVATTWMKVCLAGDMDRCEIGYRRFRDTRFEGDERPVAHLFARVSCFAGVHDLCRPWDDFETTDPERRALVMAEMCMQGAEPDTCYQGLAYFRTERGYHNPVTYDLSETLCERYKSGSACRAWAMALEANWDHVRAYRFHRQACETGLQESCPDAARLKQRVDYENRQAEAAEEARVQREAAAQQAQSSRSQLMASGYSSSGYVRRPATPFGSSSRDIANWQRYERNLCLGNPTSTRC